MSSFATIPTDEYVKQLARIRELENELERARTITRTQSRLGIQLSDRIAKAKEILEHHHIHSGEGERCPICRAYAALEGK